MNKQFVVPEHKKQELVPFSKEYFRKLKRNLYFEAQALEENFVLDANLSGELVSNISTEDLSDKFKKGKLMTISKEFSFAAAHALPFHKGKCKYLHGHEWRLKVSITGPINETGMVMDFTDLKNSVKQSVIDKLDHSYINALLFNPTAENMVEYIWNCLQYEGGLKGISKIVLWETPTSHAILTAKEMSRRVNGYWDWSSLCG